MRVLLASHAFLWWIGDDPRLSPGAREVIAEGDNEVFFSTASAWELAIKSSLGRLRMPADFERFVTDQVDLNGFSVLPVQLSHALRVHGLPPHHKDPFDRMLIAQALVEDMPLVSRDRRLAGYGVRLVW